MQKRMILIALIQLLKIEKNHNYWKILLTPPKTSEETFEQFINRQNINLSFEKNNVTNKFSFYQSSNQFDEMYNKLIEEKDFKVDPNIFKDQYDLLIEKVY